MQKLPRRPTPRTIPQAKGPAPDRTGIFTSAIVATGDGQKIALFLSGRQHAGENLKDVLLRRAAELPPPIQMCDALSRNLPGELKTIVANCLGHGQRQFVDEADRFSQECRHVLEMLAVVYHNDAIARDRKLSPDQRRSSIGQAARDGPGQLGRWRRARPAIDRLPILKHAAAKQISGARRWLRIAVVRPLGGQRCWPVRLNVSGPPEN